MPDLSKMNDFPSNAPNQLKNLYTSQTNAKSSENGYLLLSAMLTYDPEKRTTAAEALSHKYFIEQPKPGVNSFMFPSTKKAYFQYPERKMNSHP
jgi:cyclin-dependent kinase 8/11